MSGGRARPNRGWRCQAVCRAGGHEQPAVVAVGVWARGTATRTRACDTLCDNAPGPSVGRDDGRERFLRETRGAGAVV
eukprot:6509991-Prymnesium_polylepis.1